MKQSLSSREVQLILKKSKKFKFRFITVLLLKGACFKVGFSVGRRFGSAVKRNLFRRKIRGYFANNGWNNKKVYLLISPNKTIDDFGCIYYDLKKFHDCIYNK